MSVSRRDVLKTLAAGAAATSVLRVIPLHAAEAAHHMIAAEKAANMATAAVKARAFMRDRVIRPGAA